MLFLRAFPFSFAILWRYLLVLPILIVALFVVAFIAVIFAFLVGFVAPFLMVMMIFAFALASGVIPVMVGMRVGLQAREIRPRNSFAGLMLPAIGYGFFEALCVMIIVAACVALFVLLTPLGMLDLMALSSAEDVVIFGNLYATSPVLTIACIVVGGGMAVALRTALLVPFAGASVGIDADGRSHTPFYGFGDGFFTMLALVVISYIGTAMAVPIVILLIAPFGIADRLVEAAAGLELQIQEAAASTVQATSTGRLSGTAGFEAVNTGPAAAAVDNSIGIAEYYAAFGTDGLIVVGLSLALFLWFFSLQCAGAVLVFLQRFQTVIVKKQERNAEREAELANSVEEKTQVQTDMMELVRSRMQNRHD